MVGNRLLIAILVLVGFSFIWKTDHSERCAVAPASFIVQSPVRNTIAMTGSFGELRNNHFHAGIDIRSARGVDGDDLLSVAKGYLRKIKIEAGNYGKAAYIEHPEGYTTMFAHLLRFRPDIESRIKMEQYKRQTFEIELEFMPNEFPLETGEMFAYMGNTGASRGTHLHFELRQTGSDEVMDPIDFGLPVQDNIAPLIKRIKVYGYDLDGNQVSEKIYGNNQLTQSYHILAVPGDVVAFGVDAVDRSNGSWRWTGIKSLQVYIDGGLFYHFTADRWSLDDTKYINAHIDYKGKLNAQGNFHRCFLLDGNKLPLYKSVQNDGLFYIGDSLEHQIKLVVGDALGNETISNFSVKAGSYVPHQTDEAHPTHRHEMLLCDASNEMRNVSSHFKFPSGCFYQDVKGKLDSAKNYSPLAYSSWHGIRPEAEPVHYYFEISIKPEKPIPSHLLDKCFIAKKRGNAYISTGGQWEKNELKSQFNQLGYYSIMVDTIAPHITPVIFKKSMPNSKKIVFKIQDNIPALGKATGLQYKAYLDGQWILMEHDAKSHTISHHFEDWISKGSHELVIIAQDDRGNVREYRNTFVR